MTVINTGGMWETDDMDAKVLVIDDDHAVLEALKRVIKHWGGEAHCVDSAVCGAAAVDSDAYDLILLDLRMPDHDGLWFMRNADLPDATTVVLTSACASPGVVTAFSKFGVNEVLQKPISYADLTGLLNRYGATA